MSFYFIDPSAMVKRYVDEVGSEWVRSITDPTAMHELIIAEIGIVEVAAAFSARQRARPSADSAIRERPLRRFLRDCALRYMVVGADRRTIDLAVRLTGRHRLRGYDAVQLATALRTNESLMRSGQPALRFVSADNDLLLAARGESLQTDNPFER
ncbi:MAG: type II toxin-antitoxin system VapC family toxin [Chloroflexota bacterium]